MNTNVQTKGTEISYYFICHRKLWLFSHKIQMEHEHENVAIGKQLHKQTYKRQNKNITILDKINVDFIRKKDKIIINEIKKTKSMEKSHKMQLLFYLKFLKENGVEAEGELNYPLIKKKEHLILDEKSEDELCKIESEIQKIINGPLPKLRYKKICKKCAYYEFCFIGEEV